MLAQRLERAQQHRQPLALDRLADEQDAQLRSPARPCGLLAASRELGLGGNAHAVGHDAVAPAVEAPRRPGGGLGDGDARVQAVHPPPAAERHRGDRRL